MIEDMRIVDQTELGRQAEVARRLGSPFVAAALAAGERQLWRAPRTAALIAGWPRDPSADAVAMRFNGALHALARRNTPGALGALYREQRGDFDAAIGAALASQDRFIADWMQYTPQTNEVGRAAAVLGGLMEASRCFGLPFELLELGSSCGLNLNLMRYRYALGDLVLGDPDSTVGIAPRWIGPTPQRAPVVLARARGVDLSPLDPASDADCERLLSFIWPDQPHRARRLEQALALARRHRPVVDRGDAPAWLADQLARTQPQGMCRVVLHSMLLQYLSPADRGRVEAAIRTAALAATELRPLARIGFEWSPDRQEVQLRLTCWPTGEVRTLAVCHAYGEWIDWRA